MRLILTPNNPPPSRGVCRVFGVRRFLNAASFAVMVQVMSACFDTKDVQELSNATLAEAEKRLSTIPADCCAPFFAEAVMPIALLNTKTFRRP